MIDLEVATAQLSHAAAIAAGGGKRMVTVSMLGEKTQFVRMTVVETNEVYMPPATVELKKGALVRFAAGYPSSDTFSTIYLNDSQVKGTLGPAAYTMAIEWDTTTRYEAEYDSGYSWLRLYITTADYTP